MPLPIAIPAIISRLPWRVILPVIGAALALWAAYSWAYDRGVEKERATWQAARVELLRLRTERKDWAAERLAKASTAVPQAGVKEIERVEIHWRDRPVRDCFDADVVRSLEEARAAVRRSATASPSND